MNIFTIAVAAIGGGLVAALLGWLNSHEAFDARKFGASCLRAIIAGVGFAAAYHFQNGVTALDFLYAFLGGAGVDVVGHRLSGTYEAIRHKK